MWTKQTLRFLTPWKRRLLRGSCWVPPPTSQVEMAWPGTDPQRVGRGGHLSLKSSHLATVTMDSGVRATAQAQGKDTARCRPETIELLLRRRETARASLSPACDVSAQEPTCGCAAGEEPECAVGGARQSERAIRQGGAGLRSDRGGASGKGGVTELKSEWHWALG